MSQQSNYKFFQGEAWACFFLRMWIGMRLMFAGLTKFLVKDEEGKWNFDPENATALDLEEQCRTQAGKMLTKAKDHMARKAAKNDMDNDTVLHFNEQISAHQRELNELRKQLAPPQPWCAHCGWEPQKPTSRPGYEWTGKRPGRRQGHHRS